MPARNGANRDFARVLKLPGSWQAGLRVARGVGGVLPSSALPDKGLANVVFPVSAASFAKAPG
jgi:hypothetical protein